MCCSTVMASEQRKKLPLKKIRKIFFRLVLSSIPIGLAIPKPGQLSTSTTSNEDEAGPVVLNLMAGNNDM